MAVPLEICPAIPLVDDFDGLSIDVPGKPAQQNADGRLDGRLRWTDATLTDVLVDRLAG